MVHSYPISVTVLWTVVIVQDVPWSSNLFALVHGLVRQKSQLTVTCMNSTQLGIDYRVWSPVLTVCKIFYVMLSWCLFLNRNFNRRRELPTRARIIVSLKHDTIELLYWMTYELCSSSIIIQLCQQRTHSECSQPLTDNTVVQWHTSCSATTTTIYIKYTVLERHTLCVLNCLLIPIQNR